MTDKAPAFTGSIPANYQQFLVPFLFEDYAADLAARVAVPNDGAVLEVACGTGVVTRHLRTSLPATVRVVASDLNSGMLEIAKTVLDGMQGIEFETADGTDLPFDEEAFDAVICQFGAMFFPDKAQGFAEAARVLKPGGRFLFSVWDSLEHNTLMKLVHETVISLSPDNPATFIARPYSYADLTETKKTLEAVGFHGTDFFVQPRESRASSAKDVMMGLVTGGPLAAELEQRGLTERGQKAVEAALRTTYGNGHINAPMQAIVVAASKPE